MQVSATTNVSTGLGERAIDAVVFDMDGVLLDSEPLHHAAVNAILAVEGGHLQLADYVDYVGTTLEDTWSDLAQRFNLHRPFSYYRERYGEEVMRLYRLESKLLPGVAWLVAQLKHRGKRLAVASSSRTEWVVACLETLGLRAQFDAVVTGDMVAHGKPDPEIYLLAAEQLGVAPERCLAIEDAPKGMCAAHRAGMVVVGVDTPYTAGLAAPTANARIASLESFDLRWVDTVARA